MLRPARHMTEISAYSKLPRFAASFNRNRTATAACSGATTAALPLLRPADAER
jgi:hypothetical protein